LIARLQKIRHAVLPCLLLIQLIFAAAAQAYCYRGYATHLRHDYCSYMHEHHIVRNAVKDGAIGSAAGALVGLASGGGLIHGALIGAGAGAGIGALRASSAKWTHPVATNVGTAAIAGLGLALAAHRGHEF
jgi:hypothetical protein